MIMREKLTPRSKLEEGIKASKVLYSLINHKKWSQMSFFHAAMPIICNELCVPFTADTAEKRERRAHKIMPLVTKHDDYFSQQIELL